MSRWSIDPDLRDRRLALLVRMLRAEAERPFYKQELTRQEMLDWAHQCSNVLNAPAPRKAIEDMSDEELLS